MFGVASGVSEHVPGHFPFKIPSDLDMRSQAMERHVKLFFGIRDPKIGCGVPNPKRTSTLDALALGGGVVY